MKHLPAISQLATLALVVVLAWGWRSSCERERAVEAQAQRDAEAAKIKAAGLELAVAEAHLRGNYLADALGEALSKQGIKSKPVVVVKGTTGPVKVGGAPLAQAPGSAQAPAAGVPPRPAAEPASPCVLYAGEDATIDVEAAAVQTKAGNVAIDGRSTLTGPRGVILDAPLSLDVKYQASPGPTTRGSGLGIGWGVTVGDRLRTGPVIPLPSFLGSDPTLTVQCDPDACGIDSLAVGVSVVWRFGR